MLRGKLSDQMKAADRRRAEGTVPLRVARLHGRDPALVWYMADVAACFAMRDMLDAHPYFKGFEIVVAAGAEAGRARRPSRRSRHAIAKATKSDKSGSITLSCGKLMTGVTIREWGAILMLRSLKSPESYFQAAFRVQSPWSYRDAGRQRRGERPTCSSSSSTRTAPSACRRVRHETGRHRRHHARSRRSAS